MTSVSTNIALIDETFKDENIRRSLKDFVFIMDFVEAASSGVTSRQHVVDALSTAMFASMTNPFSVVMNPMSRPIVLEILREGGSDLSARFLERMIPLVKTIENGSDVKEYFTVYKDMKRRIE